MAHAFEIDSDLLQKYEAGEPQYVAYPGPECLSAPFDRREYEQQLETRANPGATPPLALRISVPTDPQPAGNTISRADAATIAKGNTGARLLTTLERELELVAHCLGDRCIDRVILDQDESGALDACELATLMHTFHAHFSTPLRSVRAAFMAVHEATPERVEQLAQHRFNHLRLRVDSGVEAVMELRIKAAQRAIDAARDYGFLSTAVAWNDEVCSTGEETLLQSIAAILQSRPERIALPTRGGWQWMCRLQPLLESLDAAGYRHVGIYEFARVDDALAQASHHANLSVDCTGLARGRRTDVISVGPATLSQVGNLYTGNEADPERYRAALAGGNLPVQRGYRLSLDDVIRRTVIESIICHFGVSTKAIESAFMIEFDGYFAHEMETVEKLIDDGAVTAEDQWIGITPRGGCIAGPIARLFERRPHPASSAALQGIHAR